MSIRKREYCPFLLFNQEEHSGKTGDDGAFAIVTAVEVGVIVNDNVKRDPMTIVAEEPSNRSSVIPYHVKVSASRHKW